MIRKTEKEKKTVHQYAGDNRRGVIDSLERHGTTANRFVVHRTILFHGLAEISHPRGNTDDSYRT